MSPIPDRFFPSQTKEERVFLLIRKHWFVYIIFVFLTILMLAPVVALLAYWSINYPDISPEVGTFFIVGLSVYLLIMMGIQLFGFVDYYLDVDIVTDRRIVDIDQNGLFKRHISELHLRQVQDVNARVEGIAATLFHFGDVHIQTAGERANFVFRSIPHPYSVAKQIVNLQEQQIRLESKGISEVKELSLEELEGRAKELLKGATLAEKIKTPSFFVGADVYKVDQEGNIELKSTPGIAEPAEPVISSAPAVKEPEISMREEGEMKEGREIDLQ